MGNRGERGQEREVVGVIEEERAIVVSWQTARSRGTGSCESKVSTDMVAEGIRSGLRLAVWPGRRGVWSRGKTSLWRGG